MASETSPIWWTATWATIKAQLIEEDGKIFVRKNCEKHGSFEDLLSIDPEFSRSVERRFPGRDYRTLGDVPESIATATSSVKYGRGAVLTIDRTPTAAT